jgi:nucleotide-binding universal stress UspA family protein
MVKLSRILVPVEFSPRCRGAVQYAEALAARFHSEIVLLHVVIPPAMPYGALEAMSYSDPVELARELCVVASENLAQFVCDAPAASVRRAVVEGDPARAIVDYAATEACDLIVMPTHGYGPFRRFLLGSVTAKVLHDAACPVCTGPHMEQAPDYSQIAFRKVACAVDLGPHTREVLCYAGRFADSVGASLHVIHAIPAWATKMSGFYFDPDWGIQISKMARERLEFNLGDLKLQGTVAVESGETPAVVRTVAQDIGADLLVIGRGSTPHAHRRLPTNSYAILRESPCAVLTL